MDNITNKALVENDEIETSEFHNNGIHIELNEIDDDGCDVGLHVNVILENNVFMKNIYESTSSGGCVVLKALDKCGAALRLAQTRSDKMRSTRMDLSNSIGRAKQEEIDRGVFLLLFVEQVTSDDMLDAVKKAYDFTIEALFNCAT